MSEERFRHNDFSSGPEPFGDGFASAATLATGQVQVIHGVYAHHFPVAGMRVREARSELEERMNIAPDAIAVVDGYEVDEDTVLVEGQVLNFVKHAGEKG